jgi:hypothetical protein
MGAPYGHEPTIPATRHTAGINVAILRTQAMSKGRPLTLLQAAAATRMAVALRTIVNEHKVQRSQR